MGPQLIANRTRLEIWCGRGDSNPHALDERQPLKLVRLPVPPLPHLGGS